MESRKYTARAVEAGIVEVKKQLRPISDEFDDAREITYWIFGQRAYYDNSQYVHVRDIGKFGEGVPTLWDHQGLEETCRDALNMQGKPRYKTFEAKVTDDHYVYLEIAVGGKLVCVTDTELWQMRKAIEEAENEISKRKLKRSQIMKKHRQQKQNEQLKRDVIVDGVAWRTTTQKVSHHNDNLKIKHWDTCIDGTYIRVGDSYHGWSNYDIKVFLPELGEYHPVSGSISSYRKALERATKEAKAGKYHDLPGKMFEKLWDHIDAEHPDQTLSSKPEKDGEPWTRVNTSDWKPMLPGFINDRALKALQVRGKVRFPSGWMMNDIVYVIQPRVGKIMSGRSGEVTGQVKLGTVKRRKRALG